MTSSVLAWTASYPGLFAGPAAYEARSHFSALFGILCSPPTATAAQRLIAAQFLIIFSLLDDMRDDEFDELDRCLDAGEQSERPGVAMMQRCYHDFLERLSGESARSTKAFEEAFKAERDGVRQKRRADLRTLTEEEYHRIRAATVAVKPYIECWKILLSVTLSAKAEESLKEHNILQIATELVYLANDLGSVERDERVLADPNIVLIRARTSSRESAIESVLASYNQRAADFQRARDLVTEQASVLEPHDGKDLEKYIELAEVSVDGNLESTKCLGRYSGSAQRLARLVKIQRR